MAYGVELATDLAGVVSVDLGEDRALRLLERAGDDLAVRPTDRGVPPGHPVIVAPVDLLGSGQGARNVGAPQAGGDPDHVDPALLGDVAKRGDPHVAVVPRRRQVHVDPLGVQRRTSQWHVVLPAGEAAEPAEGRVEHLEARAVALAPHQPLGAGGHQLSMLPEQ
ncbi:MAG: hypothetical protein AVDCRST_MAG76-232 [uncultured Acidimicrobiales bacterium]|uniref:Uncharacterized protein n=1 Tax=uncultured Acidimicrobiales bacterium TaxID=310071 RepID=A0A6J4H3S1_9ACTN|nr:MAG: hypothetical protein AVDCRST_MAG76-232 [uncultured Acidimicrobiales bacterium]